MRMSDIPFGVTDWDGVERSEHPGAAGIAWWRTCDFNGIRVRIVEYSPGYLADHWCDKGHILYCLEGEVVTELADGRSVRLGPGMSLQVGDGAMAHRTRTGGVGARLFVVD
ncbi:MAG: DHCW motif cupin fold protein [Gammaproteobacteria bacterium]|nr:DHCW motif cupin fold protein [Gammaproteobacteria bacterium]